MDDVQAMFARRRRSVASVQEAVAAYYGLKIVDLMERGRRDSISKPRAVAMYLSRKLTAQTYPQIARRFDRDHTTVLDGARRIERLLSKDDQIKVDLQAIEAAL